jgi:hypothetical protein
MPRNQPETRVLPVDEIGELVVAEVVVLAQLDEVGPIMEELVEDMFSVGCYVV